MRLALGAATCLAALLATGGAQAAQRYAAQEANGGEPCTQAAPCSLKNAVSKAKSGDEVVVTGGTTRSSKRSPRKPAPTASPSTGTRGPDADDPRLAERRLRPQGPRNRETASAISTSGTTGRTGARSCGTGAVVDRVRATGTGDSGTGLQQGQECAVRDSLLRAAGANSTALRLLSSFPVAPGVARNVTAIADGAGSIGARSVYSDVTLPAPTRWTSGTRSCSGAAADLVAA